MPWIPITIAELYEAKVAALIDACNTAALAVGQANRAPGIIQGVVNDIRRKVASCKTNKVDEDTTTIPEGLRDLAVDLIIARLKTSIDQALSEDESNNVANRLKDLNRVASCEDVVDQPDVAITPEVQPSGAGVTLVRPNGSKHPFRNLGAS